MNSEKDSYDKPSRKVTRILGQMDHARQNYETSIRLDQPGSPSGRAGRTTKSTRGTNELDQSNSPSGRVGSTDPSSSRPRSFLLRDRIELALVSSRSELPLEL